MSLLIPLQPKPSQSVTVTLDSQICTVRVYQKFFGLFVDLFTDDELLIGGVIAQNGNRIVRGVYLGFTGDLMIVDMQGTDDPNYTELGSRFLLVYIPESELV